MTIAVRSFSLLSCLTAVLAFAPARAMPLSYHVAPNSTDIVFSVDVLGLTTCHGEFSKFTGQLSIDLEQPELSKVAVQIQSGSAAMQCACASIKRKSRLCGENRGDRTRGGLERAGAPAGRAGDRPRRWILPMTAFRVTPISAAI